MLTADNITITGAGVRVEHTVNTATEAVGGVWPINGLIHFVCNFLLGKDAVLEANGRGWTAHDNTSAPAYGPAPGAPQRRNAAGLRAFNTLQAALFTEQPTTSQPAAAVAELTTPQAAPAAGL